MSIKVLLADDSDLMRRSIASLLEGHSPRIELVGEASGFAQTLRLTAALKPDVLVMDLHMGDEDEYPPELVRAEVFQSTDCLLTMSLSNDEKAHALAERFGAKILLDKMKLYGELVPAILQKCSPLPGLKDADPSNESPISA